MPLALDVLGELARGIGGAPTSYLGGLVEGETLRRQFGRQDVDAQLRALQIIREQLQMTRPTVSMSGGRMLSVSPTGEATISTLPPTEAEQALIDWRKNRMAGPQVPAEHLKLFEDWQKKNPGGSYLDFYKQVIIKAPKETETEKAVEDWLAANHLPDTPENRNKARAALKVEVHPLSPEERAIKDWLEDKKLPDTAANRVRARKEISGEKREEKFYDYQRRLNAQQAVRIAQETRKEALKDKSADERRVSAIGDLEQLRGLSREINASGLLPPADATKFGMWKADFLRNWWDPTNDALVAYRGLWGPIMIGEIDRAIFDEKGVRAIQAFRAQFDMLDRLPSLNAIERLLTELEQSIQRKRQQTGAGGAAPGSGAKATKRFNPATGRLESITP